MQHLGDICRINGAEIEPVDAIIGGSPCQDLSAAGKRAGLSGERSGLFMEQIRIIKEMRAASGNKKPRFMLWENVPGVFSSNKGADFRIVLEETAKICQPDAAVPGPPKGKWQKCGCILGNGWSIAWRVFDAQFWGVPQRRRRVALVADFGGRAAPEILFERQSLPGDTAQSGTPGQETAAVFRGGAYAAGNSITIINDQGGDYISVENGDISPTLRCETHGHLPIVAAGFLPNAGAKASGVAYEQELAPTLSSQQKAAVCYSIGGYNSKAWLSDNPQSGIHKTEVCRTLDTVSCGSPACNQGGLAIVMASGQTNAEILQDKSPTLNCNHEQPIVAHPITDGYVRRLTPLECERLQGYPDGWTDIGAWTDSKGKLHKECSDTARYRALGNSIALPPWRWILGRMALWLKQPATLGSLFDGIGGFPLLWEEINGTGSCLWASEIDEFCIAVTKKRFREV